MSSITTSDASKSLSPSKSTRFSLGRRPNFTRNEIIVLTQQVHEYNNIIRHRSQLPHSHEEKKRLWNEIAHKVTQASGYNRTASELRRKWFNLVYDRKRQRRSKNDFDIPTVDNCSANKLPVLIKSLLPSPVVFEVESVATDQDDQSSNQFDEDNEHSLLVDNAEEPVVENHWRNLLIEQALSRLVEIQEEHLTIEREKLQIERDRLALETKRLQLEEYKLTQRSTVMNVITKPIIE